MTTSETRVITLAVRHPRVFISSKNSFSYLRANSVKGMLRSLDLDEMREQRIPLDNLVINISDIHDKLDVIIEVVAKNTHNDILTQIGSKTKNRNKNQT